MNNLIGIIVKHASNITVLHIFLVCHKQNSLGTSWANRSRKLLLKWSNVGTKMLPTLRKFLKYWEAVQQTKIREPWSSGYGWRLMFERSWVWIPAPYHGWTFGHFFTLICCKNYTVCLKRLKINEKEAVIGPFKKYKNQHKNVCTCGHNWHA